MGLFKQKFNPLSGSFNLVPVGTIITFKNGVANAAALPASGNTLNDARITADTGHLYVWDGTSWVDSGDIIDLKWSAIDGKPTSSVSSIDSAVGNSHAPHSDDQVIPDQLSDLSDDATHRLVTDAEKSTWNDITTVALNVMLNAFRIAQIGSLTIFSMVKGFVDEYEDESGVDTGASSNQIYNSSNDYYSPEFDSYVKLLLHLDNNANDSETIPKTVTNNNVIFSSSVKKFGTHSAEFNGTNAYLSTNDNVDFQFGSGNFTIEFWIRFTSIQNVNMMVDKWGSGLTNISFGLAHLGAIYGNKLSLDYSDGSSNYNKLEDWNPSTDTWYHIAVVRNTNDLDFYIDGTKLGTTTDVTGITIQGGVNPVKIGTDQGGSSYLNGFMDEIRISKGIARYTTNFTPAITPFVISSDMTLISNAQTVEIVPTSVRIVLFEEDINSVTLNTDLKAYVSRDNGTTFSQVTLEDDGNYITGARILSGVVDISGQPSGTDIKYKIETLNNKNLNLHGTAISWK